MGRDFWDKLITALEEGNVILSGLAGTAQAFFLSRLLETSGRILVLVESEEKAYDLAHLLKEGGLKDQVFVFPGRSLVFIKENYALSEVERITALYTALYHPRQKSIFIATPDGILHPVLSPLQMKEKTLYLKKEGEYEREEIIKNLVECGYIRVSTVRNRGEFALRGGILDIYPLNEKDPLRIEFFGDMVDSVRYFDVQTQKSGKKKDEARIIPADDFCAQDLKGSLFDYLGPNVTIFFDEPVNFYQAWERAGRRYKDLLKEARQAGKEIRELPLLDRKDIEKYTVRKTVFHSFFPGHMTDVKAVFREHIVQKELEPFYVNRDLLFSRIKEWQDKGYKVEIGIRDEHLKKLILSEMLERNISGVEFRDGGVEKGFVSPTFKLALIGERDIFRKSSPMRAKKSRRGKREETIILEDLKIGDYVVHENYGIGIFRGITQARVDNLIREYVLIEYRGGDKLYLPLDKIDKLYKYSGMGEKEPRLSKLGGSEWERTRKKVEESVREMAKELISIYAAREAEEGYAFSPDTPWQKEFEDAFPYEETPDQLKAIEEVKRDMESPRPMERLICGDVGYGKTEVAMRAAFKAVMDGKQVALLVPTTILAEQHYQTFKARFAGYPVVIECLSRFRTGREQKKIVEDLKKGVVDLVIGTHRLLSADVQFKDLGLLIIDEEHRFGVRQKEKIRLLKKTVDVLSLSATPIPRSLHMALTGLKDMSVIETPPEGRYPVTTYVMEYNEEIIKEAIQLEIERGGQVFFVHNRIEDIYKVKEDLQKLLPCLKIAVGHGRMEEEELSRIMMDFIQGEYNLLLCTTIIESGLDMPNVNTIIVDEADKMGLAQLYQLRGRVGRSNRLAYAYLTYRPYKVLTEEAQKRLNAMREFNELGAGMKIALRDLEIRGAGNILGPEQHGHIQAVGFDLYCRLLEEETARLRGEKKREEREAPQVDIDLDYYIPDSYIPDLGSKVRIYRRLLLASDLKELEEIKRELLDRFGPLPLPVENFLRIASLRIMAKDKDIRVLKHRKGRIDISLNHPLPEGITSLPGRIKVKKVDDHTMQLYWAGTEGIKGLEEVLSLI
ncbi:transcription-repair coupling factor [Thermosyntropha lipolytica DSM 11003]|uniref:Transcription-repair-coupling factor n=1 Tax=Thermosyntropha lipolytica DSM 11003 TaxID=1123382 RepID=A0A1M5JT48_9FIRM|nr:transcription-repair coupling factor [Thermosyntropha lipolytica]SHG43163.1 transcription-repair coupling factor [Thermosyntropha lipolytica DSM 11003]